MRKIPYLFCSKCGKDRRHQAKGLCYVCYYQERFKSNSSKLIVCGKCGKRKTHHSKGLCQTCYKVEWAKTRLKEKGMSSHNRAQKRKSDSRYYKENKAHISAQRMEYYQRNKETIKRKQHERYIKNKDAYRATIIKWGIENRERLLAGKRKYHVEHREEHKQAKNRRRARVMQVPSTFTKSQWQEILSAHRHSCAYCGTSGVPLEQEHKLPIGRGGSNTADNIVPSCRPCNQRKHLKTDTEFREWLKKQTK